MFKKPGDPLAKLILSGGKNSDFERSLFSDNGNVITRLEVSFYSQSV